MQAGTFALALLLLASVLSLDWSFQERLTSTLAEVQSVLNLSIQIRNEHESTARAFWQLYRGTERTNGSNYYEGVRKIDALVRHYDEVSISAGERAEIGRVRDLETQFLAQTSKMLVNDERAERDQPQELEAERLSMEAEITLGRLEQLQCDRLQFLDGQVQRSSYWLAFLILIFAGWAMLALTWIRRTHQNHLWAPLDHLRQMVGEVRCGNLNVTGEIPESVELGSLVGAFLDMAVELREMRNSLEQKVLERTAKLEKTQNELLQSAKLASLGQLVSGVAHEINNPLTSILGFSEILLEKAGVDASIHGRLRTIRDEALRLRNLVANLNSFARRAPHRSQRFDLRTATTRLAELRNYQLHADNIALHVSQPRWPVWVVADPDQFLQVALNLVLNAEQAIKECRDRGDIWLTCGLDDQRAWFAVKDNGSGMSSEVREHIFDPFFTTKPAGNGTGLGLSISHGIIQQHRGTITVESVPAQGTTIRIVLPCSKEEPIEGQIEARSDMGKETGQIAGLRALVIDDEVSILDMVSDALEGMNCHATLVDCSASVEAALERGEFDFVMCDLKMPALNGLEIYRLVRRKRPNLAEHFLLMTGDISDSKVPMRELAAVPVLLKPFSLDRLREAIAEVIQKGALPDRKLPSCYKRE